MFTPAFGENTYLAIDDAESSSLTPPASLAAPDCQEQRGTEKIIRHPQ